ncbi:hypothetical protein HWI79_2362 [Cryptosporidium felis]|nr:hypothetical protein HWI79_2362 [Cryptosporidium felis]
MKSARSNVEESEIRESVKNYQGGKGADRRYAEGRKECRVLRAEDLECDLARTPRSKESASGSNHEYPDLGFFSGDEVSLKIESCTPRATVLTEDVCRKTDDYLDSQSKYIPSRSSSLQSIESITFGEYNHKSCQGRKNEEQKEIKFGPPEDKFEKDLKICRKEVFCKSPDKKQSESLENPGFFSVVSSNLLSIEKRLSLSEFGPIKGLKAFFRTGASKGGGDSNRKCVRSQYSEDSYDSQRSESDASMESIRYPFLTNKQVSNELGP